MVDVWGAQAVIANNTKPFTQAEFLDEIANIIDDLKLGKSDPKTAITACMIAVFKYANCVGIDADAEAISTIRSLVASEWKKRTR